MRKEDYLRKQLQMGIIPSELDLTPYYPWNIPVDYMLTSKPAVLIDGLDVKLGVVIFKKYYGSKYPYILKRVFFKKVTLADYKSAGGKENEGLFCHCKAEKVLTSMRSFIKADELAWNFINSQSLKEGWE